MAGTLINTKSTVLQKAYDMYELNGVTKTLLGEIGENGTKVTVKQIKNNVETNTKNKYTTILTGFEANVEVALKVWGLEATKLATIGAEITEGADPDKVKITFKGNKQVDLYEQSKTILLHPHGVPLADTSEDIILIHAVNEADLVYEFKKNAETVLSLNLTCFADHTTDEVIIMGSTE